LPASNGGNWGSDGKSVAVLNPATEESIGRVAHASIAGLDRSLAAADRAFRTWQGTPVFGRYKLMRPRYCASADLQRSAVAARSRRFLQRSCDAVFAVSMSIMSDLRPTLTGRCSSSPPSIRYSATTVLHKSRRKRCETVPRHAPQRSGWGF